MRFTHADGTVLHAAYCTNVHPAEDVDGLVAQLTGPAAAVREGLQVPRLGVGLWLPARAAGELAADPAGRVRLRRVLDAHGLEVVTLNAFPYAHFQAPVVKRAVYAPDWSRPERLRYTLDAATVLADLMPDDAVRGSVSTLPLGWRDGWDERARGAARVNLAALQAGLADLEGRTGRTVRVGVEPEPGCVVETTEDAVAQLGGVDPQRVGVCVDSCHLATAWEDPGPALARLGAAGLPVVKAQVSAALQATAPRDARTRSLLEGFAEPRFLHQVRERGRADRRVTDDLDEALAPDGPLPGDAPWRVHFHVPLHAVPQAPLTATTDVLDATLRLLAGGEHPLTDHLEVETYTWSVLPAADRPRDDAALVAGLVAEMAWLRARLTGLGLRAEQGSVVDLTRVPEEVEVR